MRAKKYRSIWAGDDGQEAFMLLPRKMQEIAWSLSYCSSPQTHTPAVKALSMIEGCRIPFPKWMFWSLQMFPHQVYPGPEALSRKQSASNEATFTRLRDPECSLPGVGPQDCAAARNLDCCPYAVVNISLSKKAGRCDKIMMMGWGTAGVLDVIAYKALPKTESGNAMMQLQIFETLLTVFTYGWSDQDIANRFAFHHDDLGLMVQQQAALQKKGFPYRCLLLITCIWWAAKWPVNCLEQPMEMASLVLHYWLLQLFGFVLYRGATQDCAHRLSFESIWLYNSLANDANCKCSLSSTAQESASTNLSYASLVISSCKQKFNISASALQPNCKGFLEGIWILRVTEFVAANDVQSLAFLCWLNYW